MASIMSGLSGCGLFLAANSIVRLREVILCKSFPACQSAGKGGKLAVGPEGYSNCGNDSE
jgi:hypothetical protein